MTRRCPRTCERDGCTESLVGFRVETGFALPEVMFFCTYKCAVDEQEARCEDLSNSAK